MTPEMAVDAVMKYWEKEMPGEITVTAAAPEVRAMKREPARH